MHKMAKEIKDSIDQYIEKNKEIKVQKEYLGDGLYVDFDGYQVRLSANNGIEDTNVVYLDSDLLKAFLNYIERLKESYKS